METVDVIGLIVMTVNYSRLTYCEGGGEGRTNFDSESHFLCPEILGHTIV